MATLIEPPSKQDPYLLGRDHFAATRLNCQHWTWRQELGFNLYPKIPVPDGARIADVATGTCAWLLEVAEEHPEAHIDGFDISLAQAPPSVWMPWNTALHEWDIFNAPPEELHGKYDIVHIRLVGIVIRDSSPLPVLHNAVMLLKPGGWIQWDEVDLLDRIIMHPDPTVELPAIHRQDHMMRTAGGPIWVKDLEGIMREDGLEEAGAHRVKPQLRMMKAYSAMHMMSFMEIERNMPDSDQKRVVLELGKQVQEETAKGGCFGTAKVITFGRKASGT